MRIGIKAAASQPLIVMDKVVRQVEGPRQQIKTLLQGVSWSLHPGERVAIVARKRAEADAFLECACGVSPVQGGAVTISAHVSWPLGKPAALLGGVSARLNAEFLQRIYGDPHRRHAQMQTIRLLSDLELDYFDRPLRLYNSAMKARFRLAVSIVFDFDVYAVPSMDAWSFAAKSLRTQRFREVFELMTKNASLLVTNPDINFQKAYCSQGLVLDNGAIIYQGDIDQCHAMISETSKKRTRGS